MAPNTYCQTAFPESQTSAQTGGFDTQLSAVGLVAFLPQWLLVVRDKFKSCFLGLQVGGTLSHVFTVWGNFGNARMLMVSTSQQVNYFHILSALPGVGGHEGVSWGPCLWSVSVSWSGENPRP